MSGSSSVERLVDFLKRLGYPRECIVLGPPVRRLDGADAYAPALGIADTSSGELMAFIDLLSADSTGKLSDVRTKLTAYADRPAGLPRFAWIARQNSKSEESAEEFSFFSVGASTAEPFRASFLPEYAALLAMKQARAQEEGREKAEGAHRALVSICAIVAVVFVLLAIWDLLILSRHIRPPVVLTAPRAALLIAAGAFVVAPYLARRR